MLSRTNLTGFQNLLGFNFKIVLPFHPLAILTAGTFLFSQKMINFKV